MNKEKLIHQLFVGKVSNVIGFDKTTELLKEAKDAINAMNQGQTLPIDNVCVSALLEDLLDNQVELINSPMRANVVSVEAIKQVFRKIGITEKANF